MQKPLIKLGTELSIGVVKNITKKGVVIEAQGQSKTVTFADAEASLSSMKGTKNGN